MREILFRGKAEQGEWVYGLLGCNYFRPNEKYYHIHNCETDDIQHEVIPETIGQFTGLKFKGVKAFVGDIVKGLFLHGSAILGIVDFQDGAFGLAWKRGKINEFSPFPCMCNVDYEIVGNIHDNPELLGE